MKKDISFLPVEGIKVAIVRKINEINQPEWQVVLINRNKVAIANVFVTSTGYGFDKDENAKKTSTLRHYFTEILPESHQIIEPITEEVFHLTNEYWVSYFIDNQIYDKKFIFVPDSITDKNLIPIYQLELEGILHE
ncbi:MAG: hypothetical protein U0Y10_03625 [Spirosomataceae bacterium]